MTSIKKHSKIKVIVISSVVASATLFPIQSKAFDIVEDPAAIAGIIMNGLNDVKSYAATAAQWVKDNAQWAMDYYQGMQQTLAVTTEIQKLEAANEVLAQSAKIEAWNLAKETANFKVQSEAFATSSDYINRQTNPAALYDGCDPAAVGSTTVAGGARTSAAKAQTVQNLKQRTIGFSTSEQNLTDLDNLLHEDNPNAPTTTADDIMPGALVYRTLENESKAEQAVILAANPTPPEQLTTRLLGTRAGKIHENEKKMYTQRMAAPNDILGHFIASEKANYPYTKWAQDLWAEIKASDHESDIPQPDFPGAVTRPNGQMMSMMSTLDLLVKARFENEKWFTNVMIGGKSTEWAERENTMISGIRMKMDFEMLKYTRLMAYIAAVNEANRVNTEMKPELKSLHEEASKQSLSGSTK